MLEQPCAIKAANWVSAASQGGCCCRRGTGPVWGYMGALPWGCRRRKSRTDTRLSSRNMHLLCLNTTYPPKVHTAWGVAPNSLTSHCYVIYGICGKSRNVLILVMRITLKNVKQQQSFTGQANQVNQHLQSTTFAAPITVPTSKPLGTGCVPAVLQTPWERSDVRGHWGWLPRQSANSRLEGNWEQYLPNNAAVLATGTKYPSFYTNC